MNDLEKFFIHNQNHLIHKWNHYFDIYNKHFERYRNTNVVILEIGVFQGGSLQMWKNYFGNRVQIYGIDINPECKKLEENNIKIFIGSQSDRKFLKNVKEQIPPLDILIDDGGHTMTQQIVTFEEMFDHVKDDGVYLCEDLHTSYWMKYGGGYKRRGTFIEYSKNFIDSLNAFHSEQTSLTVNSFTKTVNSLHYYDSILVIEKKLKEKPYHSMTGKPSIEFKAQSISKLRNMLYILKYNILYLINSLLRFFRISGFKWR